MGCHKAAYRLTTFSWYRTSCGPFATAELVDSKWWQTCRVIISLPVMKMKHYWVANFVLRHIRDDEMEMYLMYTWLQLITICICITLLLVCEFYAQKVAWSLCTFVYFRFYCWWLAGENLANRHQVIVCWYFVSCFFPALPIRLRGERFIR